MLQAESALPETGCEGQLSADDVISHIRYLASDDMRGRMSGTPGAEKAAGYIASEFNKAGLEKYGDDDSYYQQFPFIRAVTLGYDNSFETVVKGKKKEFTIGEDFNTLSISSSGTVDSGLVFAGYGISAPELDYDDYAGLDVKGKTVMVLRYTPEGYEATSPFYDYAALRYKAMNAREKGAKAVVFVTPYSQEEEENLNSIGLDYSYSDSGIQTIILRREEAVGILSSSGNNLHDLEQKLSNKKKSSFILPDTRVIIKTHVVEEQGLTSNVIGLLEGSDPVLKNEYIVIGAHYDHIGLGERNSRAQNQGQLDIHNGADDNASGVSGLIELAKYFSCKKDSLKRSLIFIAFSAEELGLIGSSYYVDNPKVPMDKTVAMINMDMIGRLRDNNVTVFGIGSSPEWKGLINNANAEFDFKLSFNNSGFAPSDQSVFFSKGIPVLHFFTGLHQDYHTPGDDWDKVNPQGEKKILNLISDIVKDLNYRENRIAFSNIEEPKRESSKFNVYLGTIPDYSNQVDGVKLMGVKAGSPAEKAGLRDDDTIIMFNGVSIKNIYDYMYALGDSKPGVPANLVVIRNYNPLSLIIVPEPMAGESNH